MYNAHDTFETQILRAGNWRTVLRAEGEAQAIKQALNYAMIAEVESVRVICNVKSGQQIHVIKAAAPAVQSAPQRSTAGRAPVWMSRGLAKRREAIGAVSLPNPLRR